MKLGKKFGKDLEHLELEQVVLTKFDLTQWIRNYNNKNGNLRRYKKYVKMLIEKLDKKPFAYFCDNPNCDKPAEALVPEGVRFYCSDCDPNKANNLVSIENISIKTYDDLVNYIGKQDCARNRRFDILRMFIFAKGLPLRSKITRDLATEFFKSEGKIPTVQPEKRYPFLRKPSYSNASF